MAYVGIKTNNRNKYMSAKKLDGKVAVVTGASKGIGAAIFASADSAWLTGETLTVAGGYR
jgi:NADP-dependent 3-hydroxy acid dehydrogenase YdfG